MLQWQAKKSFYETVNFEGGNDMRKIMMILLLMVVLLSQSSCGLIAQKLDERNGVRYNKAMNRTEYYDSSKNQFYYIFQGNRVYLNE